MRRALLPSFLGESLQLLVLGFWGLGICYVRVGFHYVVLCVLGFWNSLASYVCSFIFFIYLCFFFVVFCFAYVFPLSDGSHCTFSGTAPPL